MKLRSHLILLVVVALLPLLVFTGVMVVLYDRQQRATVENRLVDTTRALSLAVDREVTAWISTLEALGSSKYLDSGNLSAFREEAGRVLKTRKDWNNILLTDSEGLQLLNLFVPPGFPLPHVRDLEQFQQVIKTFQPVASNLFLGRTSRRHVIGVAVPIVRDGKIRYVLASSTLPDSLLRILAEQDIPADWIGTIIDRKGVIIARSRNFQQLVGKLGMVLRGAKGGEEEGLGRGATEDGTELRVAFHRSELTGWTVRLAIPVSALEAPLRRSLWITAGGSLSLLLAGIIAAALSGRQISNSINSLSSAAAALGRSEVPQTTTSPIIEVNKVARVIEETAAERKRADEQLQRSLEQITALQKINRDVASILDLDTLLPRMAEEARKILNTDYGYFRLLQGEQLVPRAFSGADLLNLLPVNRLDDCFAADILRENRAIILHRPGGPRGPNENGKMLVKAGYRSFLGVPMRVKNHVIGTAHLGSKEHREFSAEEIKLMETFADQAAIAFHNSQLYEAILQQAIKLAAANEEIARANIKMKGEIAQRKRLEQEVAEISGKERRRIGQDLHDGLGQELTGIAFLAKGLEEKLRRQSLGEAGDAEKITRLVNEAIRHTRALARALSPLSLEATGLMSALEELADSVRSVFRIGCEFRCDRPVLLNDNRAAMHLYRIAQEAVDNAVKHGQPKRVVIDLSLENGNAVLSVRDDGKGFPESIKANGGMGLRIMKYRAEMIEGSLDVRRGANGGTVVTCALPRASS